MFEDKIVSSRSVKVLDFPCFVLASPRYMNLYIMDALESLDLDYDTKFCDYLTAMIESSVMAASESFGVENFVAVAYVEVVNIQVMASKSKDEVIGQETLAHLYMASKLKAGVIGQETLAHLNMASKLI